MNEEEPLREGYRLLIDYKEAGRFVHILEFKSDGTEVQHTMRDDETIGDLIRRLRDREN